MRKYTKTNWANNRNNSLFWIEWRAKFIWTQTNVMGTRKEGEIHGNRIYSSAVCISLVLQSMSFYKESRCTISCSLNWSAEICPNLSEMHITHSFKGVQLLKNPWAPHSYSCCFSHWPISSIFPVKPSPSSLSFWGERNGGAGSKVTPILSWLRYWCFTSLFELSISLIQSQQSFTFSSPTFSLFPPFSLLISSGFSYMEVCIYNSPHCPVFNNWEASPPKAFSYRKKKKKVHSIICLHHLCKVKAAPSKSFFHFLMWWNQ